jgi:hypothetical protein
MLNSRAAKPRAGQGKGVKDGEGVSRTLHSSQIREGVDLTVAVDLHGLPEQVDRIGELNIIHPPPSLQLAFFQPRLEAPSCT